MNDHYYDVELRGKHTGVIYKSFQTRVYKEALKLYLPCVEEINDVEAFALIKKDGELFAEIRWYEIAKSFKEKRL